MFNLIYSIICATIIMVVVFKTTGQPVAIVDGLILISALIAAFEAKDIKDLLKEGKRHD